MKTVKEAAKEYAKITDRASEGWVMSGFFACVEFAQRWISVDEELPEQTMETVKEGNYTHTAFSVLVKTSNGRYATAKRRMFLDHGWTWKGSGTFNDSVTHWRYIELK
jgi:hypothetical protein